MELTKIAGNNDRYGKTLGRMLPLQTGLFDSYPEYHSYMNEDGTQTIEIDLPGVARNDLELTVSYKRLWVNAKRGSREYKYVVSLPETHVIDSADAVLSDGVLKITFQKAPEKRIEVR